MQIEQTETGRVLTVGSTAHPLPALNRTAQVHVWQRGDDYTVYVQQQDQPEEIPASSGWQKVDVLELEPDAEEVLGEQKRELCEKVDALRDGKIFAGFTHNGIRYQTRKGDLDNLAGKAVESLMEPESEQHWIAEDNSITRFTGAEFRAFAKAVSEHKSSFIFAARNTKNTIINAPDYETASQALEDASWMQ